MSVDIGLRVRMQQVEASLQQLPGWTRREARKAASAMEREWKRIPAAARRAAREAEREMSERMRLIRQVSANTLGDVVNDLGDVGELAAALGPAGLAAAAGLAAIGGAAVGIGLAARAMYDLASGADEIIRRLDEQNPAMARAIGLTQQHRQAAADLALENQQLTDALQGLQAVLGAELADDFIRLVRLTTASVLAFSEAATEAERMAAAIGRIASAADRASGGALSGGAQGALAGVLGFDAVSLLGGTARSVSQAEELLSPELARVEALRQIQLSQRAGASARAGATGRAGGGVGGRAPAGARNPFGPDISFEAEYAELDRSVDQQIAQGMRQQIALERELLSVEQDLAAARAESTQLAIEGAAAVVSALGGTEAAVRAAAIGQIIAYQGIAAARAFAELGPIAGAIAIAKMALQLAPYLAQLGGGGGGRAAAVATAAGGVGAALTARAGASEGLTVVQTYRHEVFDRASSEALNRTGSPLRDQVIKQRHRRGRG